MVVEIILFSMTKLQSKGKKELQIFMDNKENKRCICKD